MRRGASFGAARGFGGRARRRSGGGWTRWVGRRGTAGARRGWFPRANGATLAGGRASPDTVLGAGASRGDRGSCAARTSRKNCLERAFASGRLAEKTGAPAGALRPWLVANRASELLSAMTMAAAPLCPVAFPSPPHARFARVSNGRRLSLARRPTVADVPEMRDDETARREWRPGRRGASLFPGASAMMMDPRRGTSQRTRWRNRGFSRSRPPAVARGPFVASRRAPASTRARSSPFQRAREVRDRSRVMSGWASSPPQVRIPPPAASPSPPRRSSDPPSSRCFRLAASRFIPPPPLPRRDPAPDRALTPIHPVHARRRGTAAASPPGPPPTTAASASPTASPSPRTSPTPCRPTRAR